MKNLLKIGSGVAALSTLAAFAMPLAVIAWGPGRTTYTTANPATSPVFNSITDNPKYGDERNFAHIKESGQPDSAYSNSVNLVPGKTYDVFVYYHNNASESFNGTNYNGTGVMKGAFARVEFPSTIKGSAYGNVHLGATNATHVWDTITFKSVEQVSMHYVSGSAKLHNFAEAKAGSAERTFNLSDAIFGQNGHLIGFNKMDGILPGCNFYSGYITFKITVDNPVFTLQKQVRIKGDTEWKENVNAKAGDIVEFQLTYRNTGNTNQMNVTISDKLPAGLTYISGSTKIRDGIRPNGASLPDGIIGSGLVLGNYAPAAAAYVLFEAKVSPKTSDLVCGDNKINNIGKVTVGTDSKEDDASVTVKKDCKVEKCDIPGKTHLPKDDPKCKEDEKCDVPGKTHLPKDDPKCKEDEKCDVPGKTHLPKNDPKCKEDIKECKPGIPAGDPRCYDMPLTGPESIVTGLIGLGSLATAGTYYIRSRKQLN